MIAHTPPRAPNRDYDQVLDVDRVHGRDYGKRAEHDRASAVDLNALPGDIDARRALPQRAAGFHDATGDSKTVARWWDRWTHANIGVLTDPTSRLVVVLDRPRWRHHLAHRVRAFRWQESTRSARHVELAPPLFSVTMYQ